MSAAAATSATSPAVPWLAPDARVPGRDVLLEPGAMAGRLARLMGVDGPLAIEGCRRGRAKYRVGGSLRVVHELRVGGATRVVAARTFPDGRSADVYERALATGHDAGPLRPVAHDPELEAVFWAFPNDRKIATLDALAPAPVARQLGRPVGRTELAAYAPEKSATAACLDAASGRAIAYAKVFASADELRAAHEAHAAVSALAATTDGALRVPALLAVSEGDRMLVVEAVEGRRVDALEGASLEAALRALGAALAALHELPPPVALQRFERLDRDRPGPAAELIGRARPDAAGAAATLAAELAGSSVDPGEDVCLHGDLHLKNGLLDGDRVTLIDLDQAGAGPAAADLGSALAALRARALLAGDVAHGERLQAALLDGYGARREPPAADALRWHVAAALLCERALRAVNRVRPDALAQLGAMLEDARAVLRAEAPLR